VRLCIQEPQGKEVCPKGYGRAADTGFSSSDTLKSIPYLRVAIALLVLSAVAIAIHGYHPYAEDSEIYLPGVEKALQPTLFPVGTDSFEAYANASIFSKLIVLAVRITRLPLPYALFAWHFVTVFLFLLACWELSGKCFESVRAKTGAVLLVASSLTLPIAGTALYIMDQYLNPRNLAAFACVFAVTRTLEGRHWKAAAWLVFAAAMHPLMAAFAISFCVLEPALRRAHIPALAYALLPLPKLFEPSSSAYHAAAQFHGFHYILNWHWYEVLGIFGPIPLLVWFSRMAESQHRREMAAVCRALVVYDLVYFAAALIVSVPSRFEVLARIQPLRSLHLLYILLLILGGGLIAEHILKKQAIRWMILFVPLAAGMCVSQRALFSASAHVEWPWAIPRNEWARAFLWIRQNTPTDSKFAIDPYYMNIPGEDAIGFRALAQRSRLADALKDSGSVSMFPALAENWYEQYQAVRNWKEFKADNFAHLNEVYGVNWVVLQAPAENDLSCPYRNPAVLVCQIGH